MQVQRVGWNPTMRIKTHFAKGKYGPANLVSAPPQRLRSRSGHRNAKGCFQESSAVFTQFALCKMPVG